MVVYFVNFFILLRILLVASFIQLFSTVFPSCLLFSWFVSRSLQSWIQTNGTRILLIKHYTACFPFSCTSHLISVILLRAFALFFPFIPWNYALVTYYCRYRRTLPILCKSRWITCFQLACLIIHTPYQPAYSIQMQTRKGLFQNLMRCGKVYSSI